jgi:hypothetical protein
MLIKSVFTQVHLCLTPIRVEVVSPQLPRRTRAHVFRVGDAAATQCTQSAQHVTAPIRHSEQPTAPPARPLASSSPSFSYWTRQAAGHCSVLRAVWPYSLSCLTSLTLTRRSRRVRVTQRPTHVCPLTTNERLTLGLRAMVTRARRVLSAASCPRRGSHGDKVVCGYSSSASDRSRARSAATHAARRELLNAGRAGEHTLQHGSTRIQNFKRGTRSEAVTRPSIPDLISGIQYLLQTSANHQHQLRRQGNTWIWKGRCTPRRRSIDQDGNPGVASAAAGPCTRARRSAAAPASAPCFVWMGRLASSRPAGRARP